jgi:integrase
MPVYSKGRERWRVVIWRHGSRHDWVLRGTKGEAKAFEATKLVELQAGEPLDKQIAPLFSDFSTGPYAAHARVHLRKGTRSVRKYQLATLIEHFGAVKLTEIAEDRIEAFKNHRIEVDGVEPSTVNSELNALSAVLTYARDVLRLPCARPRIMRLPIRRKKARLKVFSTEAVGHILRATELVAPHLYPLVVLLFESGARKAEAINLPWSNVLLEQRMLRIWSEVDEDEEPDEDAFSVKSREREVPLSDHLAQVLAEQKAKGLSGQWVFPTSRRNNDGVKGERYAHFPKHTWERVLAKATELARKVDPQAPAFTGGPHRARHTFASHFLRGRPDLFLLGRVLGHSHSRVTELYGHLLPDHLAEARNVVQFAAVSVPVAPAAPTAPTAPTPRAPSERPQNRARDRARRLAVATRNHGSPGFPVGAIGFEPTTPTVST